jgi:hypothetical protein
MRWANTLAPSAESRRAFGTGPDDCVSSRAGVSPASIETPPSTGKRRFAVGSPPADVENAAREAGT